MDINLFLTLDFDNLIVVVLSAIAALGGAISAYYAITASQETNPRCWTVGNNIDEGDETVVKLKVHHGKKNFVSFAKCVLPGRKEEPLARPAHNVRHGADTFFDVKVPTAKVDKAKYSFKKKNSDEYILVVKW